MALMLSRFESTGANGLQLASRQQAASLAYMGGICRILTASFQLSRNWLVVTLSVYRYEAVCRVTAGTTLFRASRMTGLLVFIGVAAFLLVLPRIFEFYEIICPETTYYYMFETYGNNLQKHAAYRYFYLSTVIFILQTGGPVLCVALFSALVTRVLWERQKFRNERNMRSRSSSSDKLMIALAVTFFVLETPSFFSKLLADKIPVGADALLVSVSNLCIYMDSTMNIFVYLISNPTFRKASLSITNVCTGYVDEPAAGSARRPEESAAPQTQFLLQTCNTVDTAAEVLGDIDSHSREAPSSSNTPSMSQALLNPLVMSNGVNNIIITHPDDKSDM